MAPVVNPGTDSELEEYEKQKEKREKDLEDAFSATLTMCADNTNCADIIRHLNTISVRKENNMENLILSAPKYGWCSFHSQTRKKNSLLHSAILQT